MQKRDPFTITKRDLQNEQLLAFLRRADEMRREATNVPEGWEHVD